MHNFNPAKLAKLAKLNTDQWAETAVSSEAKYSVLNVKDESGFLLWDTKCPWPDGTPYNYAVRPMGATQPSVGVSPHGGKRRHSRSLCGALLRSWHQAGTLLPAVGQLLCQHNPDQWGLRLRGRHAGHSGV